VPVVEAFACDERKVKPFVDGEADSASVFGIPAGLV
jgi:hypothetical protein